MKNRVDEQWEVEWMMQLSKESTADISLLCGKAKSRKLASLSNTR